MRKVALAHLPPGVHSLPHKQRNVMRTYFCRRLALGSILLAALVPAQAQLIHRYSFTDSADDSAGQANGTLQGNAVITDGAVVLDGTTETYVDLPGGLINGLSSLTIEFWASLGVNANWTRLFDFGDVNGTVGRNYLFFSPHSGAGDTRVVYSDTDPGYNHELLLSIAGALDNQGPVHVACVFDPPNSFMGFYTNGVLAAARTDLTFPLSSVRNVKSWLGRSLYSADGYMTGSIDEFRLYGGALNGVEIAGSYASGADTPGTDPGELRSVGLQVDGTMILTGTQQAAGIADFASVKGVNLIRVPDVVYSSSKPAVVTATAAGALKAVGLGTATITVNYRGKQASQTVTVVESATPVLKHRWSFNEAAGETTAKDSVGTADGTLEGGASLGTGSVVLDGSSGYVNLPNGIISTMTNATFEVWTTWNGPTSSSWQRIFDFGSNSAGEDQAGTGQTYLFLTPRSGAGSLRFAATATSSGGEQMLNRTAALATGKQTHLVVTYNYSLQIGKLYANGLLVATNRSTIALSRIVDINNWLGRSNWPDPYYGGAINEFRIYEGILGETRVAISGASGPDKLVEGDPGALVTVQLKLDTTTMPIGGLPAQAGLYADFQNIPGVNVSGFKGALFASSDTNVATIDAVGLVTPLGAGSATLTGTYQDKTANVSITVVRPPGASEQVTLIHRYSFSEPIGSTEVVDSVGGANGTLIGTGAFTGDGRLSFPGTDGYVDLPNYIISVLTNATFEAWVTWKGVRTWERVFDFGSNSAGEDQQGTGTTFIFLSPRGGTAVARVGVVGTTEGGDTAIHDLDGRAAFGRLQTVHVVVAYDYAAGAQRLYVNGVRVAVGPATVKLTSLNDVNNWLGRSNWPDPFFLGDFNEFRIYDGALLDKAVAANFAAGPDTVPTDVPKVPLSVSLSGANLTISWSAQATGFGLEGSARVGAGANWAAVNAAVTVEGGLNKVTLPLSGQAMFYRLRR